MHISIQEGRSLPDFQRCTTCCEDFHCPFCASNVFHPAKSSKVQTHLESHFNRAVLYERYTIHRCALNCRPQFHFHCFYCQSMLTRKADFIKHLALCKSIIRRILRFVVLEDGDPAICTLALTCKNLNYIVSQGSFQKEAHFNWLD
ncbi:hypothetical protein F7725_004241, partial [Dissostichus mawsoni]